MTNQRRTETDQAGDRSGNQPTPFAEVMREQGMTAPRALTDSMNIALGRARDDAESHEDAASRADNFSADDLLRAAENLLDKVLATQCDKREAALDLLTVDALVTRAMEIAARDPQLLGEFPENAMKRIAAK